MRKNTFVAILDKYGYNDILEGVEAYIREEPQMLDCCVWKRSMQYGIG